MYAVTLSLTDLKTREVALRDKDIFVWHKPINVTKNNVVASVDAAGLVYFLSKSDNVQ